ncbi:ATP-binding protein [Halomonas organivorans]
MDDRVAEDELIGRAGELARLGDLLAGDGPRVAHLHGVAGIGKTALLRRFVREAPRKTACWWLDCRDIEPTPEGCIGALGWEAEAEADAERLPELPELLEVLAGRAPLGVIVLDSVEAWRLLDTWLCHHLAARLPGNLRLVLAGRHRPSVHWVAAELPSPPPGPAAGSPDDGGCRPPVGASGARAGPVDRDRGLVARASAGHPVGRHDPA